MLNNLMTYSLIDFEKDKVNSSNNTIQFFGDISIKVSFTGKPNCFAQERQLMINYFKVLDLFMNDKPNDMVAQDINFLCENFVFEPLIKSFSIYLFDENNNNKVNLEYNDIINKPYENKENPQLKDKYSDYISCISLTTEPNNTNDKIKKRIGSLLYSIGEKMGIKKEKTQIDISKLKIYPLDYKFTSTHVCLFIGGSFVGKKFCGQNLNLNINDEYNNQITINNNIWRKLYFRKKNIEYYFFDWISEFIPGFEFLFIDLIPNAVENNQTKEYINNLKQNDILFLKEKTIAKQNYENSKIIGKLLAYFLASKMYFNFHTVSLIGYSLGANVIKHCLKELHSLLDVCPEVKHIIQNIIFISGATTFSILDDDINNGVSTDWNEVFSISSGKIINVYSKTDKILEIAFNKFIHQKAIGNNRFFIKNNQQLDIINNYDCSHMRLSHFEFPDYIDKILDAIDII